MKVTKKINNNVAVCVDAHGTELVAFGKGIGFPKMPYELTDLSKISMTFYQLNSQYYQLLTEIPEEIFAVSEEIIKYGHEVLGQTELNPNLLFILADHIEFALERLQKYQEMRMPFVNDIESLYPTEVKIGRHALKIINQRLQVQLPKAEEVALAFHFVNAQYENGRLAEGKQVDVVGIIETATTILEDAFQIQIDRQKFDYTRFVTHLRYYIQRILEDNLENGNSNSALVEIMKQESPLVYTTAQKIANEIDQKLGSHSTVDELFYLMVYIKRITNKERK